MDRSREKAKTYLSIALDTYTQEIVLTLPKEKRYAGAMVSSALGVAQRRLYLADPAESLLHSLDARDMKTLAKSIRSGETSDQSQETLAASLMDYVEAELAITNPKFLERRKG